MIAAAGVGAARMADSLGLSSRQLAAIEALLTGASDSEVARTVGCTRETVNRWRHHNGRFMAALEQRKREIAAAATKTLAGLVERAVTVVAESLEDAADPRRQLRAAGLVLDKVAPSKLSVAVAAASDSEEWGPNEVAREITAGVEALARVIEEGALQPDATALQAFRAALASAAARLDASSKVSAGARVDLPCPPPEPGQPALRVVPVPVEPGPATH